MSIIMIYQMNKLQQRVKNIKKRASRLIGGYANHADFTMQRLRDTL